MNKQEQFRQLLEANQDRIYRLCCCYIRNEEERRDVFQNVLLQVWKNLESFAGRASLSTWLYRITVNVCLGQLRRDTRHQRLFVEPGPGPGAGAPEPAAEPECPVDGELAHLYDCIRQLPPVDRTLISLYLEEAGTAEMADVLGISEGNVRVRLHRIKKELKEIWEKTSHELG